MGLKGKEMLWRHLKISPILSKIKTNKKILCEEKSQKLKGQFNVFGINCWNELETIFYKVAFPIFFVKLENQRYLYHLWLDTNLIRCESAWWVVRYLSSMMSAMLRRYFALADGVSRDQEGKAFCAAATASFTFYTGKGTVRIISSELSFTTIPFKPFIFTFCRSHRIEIFTIWT